MKPGTLIVRIVTWVFFLCAIAYFGVYGYHVLFTTFETVRLYDYTAEDAVEAVGYMARQEQVLEGGGALQDVVPAEGETIAAGSTLVVVYDNADAYKRHQEIVGMEDRMASLQYILTHSVDASDSVNLNDSMIRSIVNVKYLTSEGDLTRLEDASAELKTLMFRRDYTYNGSSALTAEIRELADRMEALAEKNRAYTSAIAAPFSGTFSGMADGYEETLTPDNIKDLTPARFEELLSKRKEIPEGAALGRIITGSRWYFASVLEEKEAERLKIGSKVSLRFNSMDRVLEMRTESVSKPDEGRVCVVFSSDKYLSETTLLRDQTVDIIFGTVSGYRVEKSAIHVDNYTGDYGVYRVYGKQAKWVSVDVLWSDEDYYLIRQKQDSAEMSQLDQARQLRPGSEIITKGTDLYDGKVIGG